MLKTAELHQYVDLYTFTITKEKLLELEQWKKDVNLRAVEAQKHLVANPGQEYDISWKMGIPYVGAIGGNFSYEITPTSMGFIYTVKEFVTGEEINLTSFDDW